MAELVAADLRRRILAGDIEPGTSLATESTLVDEFEVSRPTLREALRLLEHEGLIKVRRGSHKGPLVTLPDAGVSARSVAMLLQQRHGTLADVYEFRASFEPVAAGLAATRSRKADVAELRGQVEEEVEAVGDAAQFTGLSWRFHTEIVRLSGNLTMTLMAEVLEEISRRHARRVMTAADDQARHNSLSCRSHSRLVDLFEAGDAAAAEAHWRGHMVAAGELLLQRGASMTIVELLDV
jgi:DNA-binding FadR family transcriptional regulator